MADTKFPPPDATREDVDRFFGKPVAPRSFGARMKISFRPAATWLVEIHHTIDELDALEMA